MSIVLSTRAVTVVLISLPMISEYSDLLCELGSHVRRVLCFEKGTLLPYNFVLPWNSPSAARLKGWEYGRDTSVGSVENMKLWRGDVTSQSRVRPSASTHDLAQHSIRPRELAWGPCHHHRHCLPLCCCQRKIYVARCPGKSHLNEVRSQLRLYVLLS